MIRLLEVQTIIDGQHIAVAYLAHCYGGDALNLIRAREWLTWLNQKYAPHRIFIAPWLHCCADLPETPENRQAEIVANARVAATCDELWCVGPKVSDGMKAEAKSATGPVFDLTGTVSPPLLGLP